MAERFSLAIRIVTSDAFLGMSLESRALYYHLCAYADSKGNLNNAHGITRFIDVDESALFELMSNGYVSNCGDGIFHIAHWDEHKGVGETAKKRLGYKYRKVRGEVIERDKCCKICGSTERLVVHHIKHFAEYPEYRFDPDNLVTLCDSCHRALHKKEREDGKKKNVQSVGD